MRIGITVRAFALNSVTLGLLAFGAAAAPPARDAPSSGARSLEKLELNSTVQGIEAVIVADGTFEHKVYVQDDPPRLVVDILDVRNPLPDQRPAQPHFLIDRVRTEELPMTAYIPEKRDATFGRITFVLKEPVDYRVHADERQLRVELFPKGSATESEEPAHAESVRLRDGVAAELTPNLAAQPLGAQPNEAVAVPESVLIEPSDISAAEFFGSPRDPGDHYRLGPEDVIEVRVFELDQLNRTVRVGGNGSIDLPLIGTMAVGGLDAEQVSARVADQLRNRFVQNPQVSIFIKEFNSRKVSLLGSVKSPATYPLQGRRNLLQILAEAGGLTTDAGKILYLFRQTEDGRSARLTVPLDDLLIAGDPRWNVWLRAGDVISIPPDEAISVSVLGAVRSPGVHKLPVGEAATLLQAIARAGGLTERASKSGVQVKRREPTTGKDIIIKADFGDILAGRKSDVVLQEGDVVVVKESFF